MPHFPSQTASRPASPPGKRTARMVALLVLAVGLAAGLPAAFAPSPASAAFACDPGSDTCVVGQYTAQTPLGLVTVTVSAGSVVTVQLIPTDPSTLVFGIPVAVPPGPPGLPGYARTSITTAAGVVNIDTYLIPPGPPGRFALPSLAIVSFHPPSPCRVQTSGTTVVFTPIIPPGPPA